MKILTLVKFLMVSVIPPPINNMFYLWTIVSESLPANVSQLHGMYL